ncbi:hypothetical protein [Streptomyces daliensis]|uniref:Uncharacterized protein n=1 Tax=Streptomyces daliensis TaxID=299421 RepID=A0A8T4ITJ2_9ACTN|nr:hypothetical protein [Streptomyces daliensis]
MPIPVPPPSPYPFRRPAAAPAHAHPRAAPAGTATEDSREAASAFIDVFRRTFGHTPGTHQQGARHG